MKKSLRIILASLLSFSSYVGAQETQLDTRNSPYVIGTSILEEKPANVVSEVLEKREVEKRDVVNIISKIDDDVVRERHKYFTDNPLEGFTMALEDNLNDDPLFYVWEDYEPNDIIVKNQAINSAWDVLIARYPKFFGRIEKTAVKIKKATTLETKISDEYKLKINPELDSDNLPRLKIHLRSQRKCFLGDLSLRLEKDKMELGKSYNLCSLWKNASLDYSLNYDFCGDYGMRATLKIPFWFHKK